MKGVVSMSSSMKDLILVGSPNEKRMVINRNNVEEIQIVCDSFCVNLVMSTGEIVSLKRSDLSGVLRCVERLENYGVDCPVKYL